MQLGSRVAVVTDELAGLNKGGGIGTCAQSLIQGLLKERFTVDIVITDPGFPGETPEFMGCRVISVVERARDRGYGIIDHVGSAYCVHEILCETNYEAVHFNDWRGSGYFYAMAKRQGLVNARVITHTHGPLKWVRAYNLTLSSPEASEIETLEMSQVENSDLVLSPSQYLIDWYKSAGVKLPAAQVLRWQLPEWSGKLLLEPDCVLATKPVAAGTIKEIIFYGRHERRKGFGKFLRAVASRSALSKVDLTFLGRFDRSDREFTGSMVYRLLPRHGGAIRFINRLGHQEAVDLLAGRPHALVVMPSECENSPCTVGECFTIGIPFLATSAGGTPELFLDGAQSPNLMNNTVEDIASKLEDVVVNGLGSVKSALNPVKIAEAWSDLHRKVNQGHARRDLTTLPRVSVCLVHHNRIALLRRALGALARQTYKNFEVVLVDDGSDLETQRELDLIEERDWGFDLSLIRSGNNYLGAARNLAARHASGEFLIFHDDDNISEPAQIETFVRAAVIGKYDVLTSQYLVFDDREGPASAKIKYFPIGSGGAFSFMRNGFGDANALVRKSTFEAIGGFSELKGVGWEDWEFFLRCYARGVRQGLVPFPLFRYRASGEGMLATTVPVLNHARILSVAYDTETRLPPELLEFAKREAIDNHVLDKTWALLGRAEHATLHRDLMALDPNSDAAREKLMELAFAMGRYSDAVEIGLGLQDGYHRVRNILDILLPRLRAANKRMRSDATLRLAATQALLCRGWIDYEGACPDLKCFRISGDAFKIDTLLLEYRPDVNEHLKKTDSLRRGFRAVAVADRDRSGAEVPIPDHTFEVDLASDHSQYGIVAVQCFGDAKLCSGKGFLELMIPGRLYEMDVGSEDPGPWLNRAIIMAEPGRKIYTIPEEASKIEEVVLDDKGMASFEISSTSGGVVHRDALQKFRLFVAPDGVDLRIALTPIM